MRKITLGIFVAVVIMVSCTGKKTEKLPMENSSVESEELIDSEYFAGDNAINSLDYKGAYEGTLPTADGQGMDVTIILNDSTYIKSVSYVGVVSAPKVEEGKYVWNDKGNTITLLGLDLPNQYFVGENVLFHLDIDGKRIEGSLAESYQLHKKD